MKKILVILIVLVMAWGAFAGVDDEQDLQLKKIERKQRRLNRSIRTLEKKIEAMENTPSKANISLSDQKKLDVLEKDLTKAKQTYEKLEETVRKGVSKEILASSFSRVSEDINALEKKKAMLLSGEEDEGGDSFGFAASFSLVSDYVWRGQTQTNYSSAVQGALDYSHSSGISLGTWVSSVTDGMEQDVYLYYGLDMGKVEATIQATWYNYPRASSGNTIEYSLALSWRMISLDVAYTDDYFGSKSSAKYINLGVAIDLPMELALSTAVGFNYFFNELSVGSTSYVDYLVTLSKGVSGFEVGMNFTTTNRKEKTATDEAKAKDSSTYVSISSSF